VSALLSRLLSHGDHDGQGGRVVRRGPKVSPCRRLEKTRVTLRKVPGALALGLLASIAAHAVVFGDEHVMGGAFHGLLVQIALLASGGLLAFFSALAWGQTSAADGTVVAARLRERLPGLVPTLTCAALCYAVAESLELHHQAASPLPVFAALATISWLVLRLAAAVAGILAGAIFAVARSPFAGRAPAWTRRARPQLTFRRTRIARRAFARPPPIAA